MLEEQVAILGQKKKKVHVVYICKALRDFVKAEYYYHYIIIYFSIYNVES